MKKSVRQTKKTKKHYRNNHSGNGIGGALILALGFIIGCLFLYWAVQYWVYNTFDSDRYEISNIQSVNGNVISLWKFDRRTGAVEYCTKSLTEMDNFTCVRPHVMDAKDPTTVQKSDRGVDDMIPSRIPADETSATPAKEPTKVPAVKAIAPKGETMKENTNVKSPEKVN